MSLGDLLNGLKGMMRPQQENERFVAELKEHFGVRHCLLVSSGKAALTLILEALKSIHPDRDEVIIPGYTCYSVPSAVMRAGLKIRLCDADVRTMGFDLEMLGRLLKGRPPLCVIPTHLFGVPCEVDSIRALAGGDRTVIVEDAAQAMGGEHGGAKLGCIGDVGFFSLGRGKALSTVAGGVILTERDDIATSLAAMASRLPAPSYMATFAIIAYAGILWAFLRPSLFWVPKAVPGLGLGKTVYDTGFPIQGMSGFQSGLARNWLAKLTEFRKKRADVIRRWLQLPFSFDATPFVANGTVPDLIRFPLLVADLEKRAKLLREAERQGLGIMPAYPEPVNMIPELAGLIDGAPCVAADQLARELITLPVHSMVSPQDQVRISNFLTRW